ncbi:hypothetical protein GCM10009122_40400 [Fulvivirga kasyanovii]|uniref:Uncharacterized protein n=1 Tax=Fulvivirga kasyanovii TaxID=396812 RepID=A0ABW9RJ51_9BACT|nr:hypothetical protein [Fulvivirga kasyanovii]MTI24006.1 hypothetical protein [Fulvivirga kasyanovii]
MKKKKIYVLLSASTPGQMGGATEIEVTNCEKCGRRLNENLKQLGYEFDFWSGEDFIHLTPYYIVSERLKMALEVENLTGYSTKKVVVDTEEYFEIDEDAYSKTLPDFYYLDIQGQAKEEPVWYTVEKYDECDMCAGEVSTYIPEILDKIDRVVLFKKKEDLLAIPKRKIYYDSWQGQDVFFADNEKRREPIITEDFLRVLKKVNKDFMDEVIVLEAEWI